MAEGDDIEPAPATLPDPLPVRVLDEQQAFDHQAYLNMINALGNQAAGLRGINYGLNPPTHQDYQNLAGLANVYDTQRYHYVPVTERVHFRGRPAGEDWVAIEHRTRHLSDWEYVRQGNPLPRPAYDALDYAPTGRSGIGIGEYRQDPGPDGPGGSGQAIHGGRYRSAEEESERGGVEAVPPRRAKEIPVRGTDNTKSVINLISSIPQCDISTAALFLSDGRAVRVTPQEVREISLVKFVDALIDQARRSSRIEERVIHMNLTPTVKLDLVPHGVSTLHCYIPPEQRVITFEGTLNHLPQYGLKESWLKMAETFFAEPPTRIANASFAYMRYHFNVCIPATIWSMRMRWPQGGSTPLYELPGTRVFAVGKRYLRHLNIGNVNYGSSQICWGSGNENIRPANPEDVRTIFYKSLFNTDLTNPRYFTFSEGGLRLSRWLAKQKKKPTAIPARFLVGAFFRNMGSVETYFTTTRNSTLE